jgi:twitching motility protein PilI
MGESESSLSRLRSKPFELLREIERRSRLTLAGGRAHTSAADEWVGIGCQLANEKFLVARNEVREVMIMPAALTRVPGAKEWVAGLANLRGQILTIVDLRIMLGAGTSKGVRSARVFVVDNPEFPVGVIVDEVFGFRRFAATEFRDTRPETQLRCDSYLAGSCVRGSDVWPVFSLAKLLEAPEFRKAAA